MKTQVYYFTGTGNSLVVAKDIATQIDAELISIPSVMKTEKITTDADIMVFVFPVYICGVPLIVERFIKKFDNLKGKSIYAVATYAGSIGGAINIFENLIKDNGGNILSGFGIILPGNYIPMYGAGSEQSQKKMFDKSTLKIKQISEHIKSRKKGIKENNNLILSFLTTLAYNAFIKHMHKADKYYWTDEKCNKCGICEQICPVDNIELKDGKPIWMGKCEQCMACLQWCPQESIQYKDKSATRKRYHNPNINISDMIKQTGK